MGFEERNFIGKICGEGCEVGIRPLIDLVGHCWCQQSLSYHLYCFQPAWVHCLCSARSYHPPPGWEPWIWYNSEIHISLPFSPDCRRNRPGPSRCNIVSFCIPSLSQTSNCLNLTFESDQVQKAEFFYKQEKGTQKGFLCLRGLLKGPAGFPSFFTMNGLYALLYPLV